MAHGPYAIQVWRIVDERRRIRCCGKQRPKEGGDFPLPRFYHGWTPRNYENLNSDKTVLLVAKYEELRYGIHQGLRHMPNDEGQHATNQTPIIPDLQRNKRSTIPNNQSRFHSQITRV